MCFSAEADLAVGLVVGVVGVDALRQATRRVELPLAAVPLVLAVHTLTEAAVWWGLDGRIAHDVYRFALVAYLAVAFVAIPVLVPAAIAILEPCRRMVAFVALGGAVAATLGWALWRGPVGAAVDEHRIDYRVALDHGGLLVALYVVATCGSLLSSAHRRLRWYGVANLAAVGALVWLDRNQLISMWCLWAAATSIAIDLHLRRPPRPADRVLVAHPFEASYPRDVD